MKKLISWYRKIRCHRKNTSEARYAFTEQGVLMFSNFLKSERALVMSIRIIEIFVKLREVLLSNKDILLKVERLERKVVTNDVDIKLMFEYIKELLDPKNKTDARN
jgi:hypothetical protein